MFTLMMLTTSLFIFVCEIYFTSKCCFIPNCFTVHNHFQKCMRDRYGGVLIGFKFWCEFGIFRDQSRWNLVSCHIESLVFKIYTIQWTIFLYNQALWVWFVKFEHFLSNVIGKNVALPSMFIMIHMIVQPATRRVHDLLQLLLTNERLTQQTSSTITLTVKHCNLLKCLSQHMTWYLEKDVVSLRIYY